MVDRKKVRKYFEGKNQLWPILLMFLGFCTLAVIIGIFLLIGGLVWFLYNKFSVDLSGESEVDEARKYEVECAKKRAKEKLNVIDEQIQNVEPVVISGRGFQPDYVTGIIASKSGFLNQIKKIFAQSINKISKSEKIKLKKKDEYEDPIYRARIGSDGQYRCSLMRTSVFMFGEKQLYIYFSNVDLATGVVYSEGTHEYFYSDINALSFIQNKEKVYNFKKKRYEGILFESVNLYASGCSYEASIFTDLNKSLVEKECAGMRALIRDRKEA